MIETDPTRAADILITNGTVIDGTGRPGFSADVLIRDGRIAAVGRQNGVCALQTIDALGKVVCPGFVDIHSHADLYIYNPDHPRVLEPLIRQGITTFLGGNCGYGLAPLDRSRHLEAQRFYLEDVTTAGFEEAFPWQSMGEYLSVLEQRGVALNVGLLCPHGLIRLQAMGPYNRHAAPGEVGRMARILEQALEEGALGLSTGLQYFPGMYSDTGELVQLGRVLRRFDGRFTSHLRSYTANTVRTAVEELVRVAAENEIHGQVSHVFTLPWVGRLQGPFIRMVRFFARHHELGRRLVPAPLVNADMRRVLGLFDRRRRAGVRLGMDMMPTTTGFTHLLAFFPPWVLAGGAEATMERLRDPAARRRIIRDVERGRFVWPHDGPDNWSINFFRLFGYECATIMAMGSSRNRELEGRRLVDIAHERHKHPLEAAMDLLVEEQRKILVFGSPAEPEDPFTAQTQDPAMVHPDVAVGTDTLLLGFGRPSYLFYGCFPRFLGHHVRERGLLDLATAVRKCTSVPAGAAGFADRGSLAPGSFADVVVFDPRTIGTELDFLHPDVTPRGIEHVLVNGVLVLEKGRYFGERRAGSVLRRA